MTNSKKKRKKETKEKTTFEKKDLQIYFFTNEQKNETNKWFVKIIFIPKF